MPSSPPDQWSLKIVKEFDYRGGTKQWSNRYFFTGANPSGSSAWSGFATTLIADEKQIFLPDVTIVGAVGYDEGSDVPVWSEAVSVDGTFVPGSGYQQAPGDCAAMVKFTTDQRSTKNHPIYLTKWYHCAIASTSGSADTLHSAMKTTVESYTQGLITGYSLDGSTRHLCGPRGAVALTRIVSSDIRHRDFPA